MVKNIKVNLEVLESMLYFWQATKDKEKVGENYLLSISDKDVMKAIYDDEFNGESVRLVLSAISNRELLNSTNKKERKFWNNNMWMLEDMDMMNKMLQPLKVLNLSSLLPDLNEISKETVEVAFFPGHLDLYKIKDEKLYINFFKVLPNEKGESAIEDVQLETFILNKLKEM